MRYSRLKLTRAYHDAMVRAVRFEGHDVVIQVELSGHCNPSAGSASISFLGVRNLEAVRGAMEAASQANRGRRYIDEIIGIFRGKERGFLLDLQTAGGVEIDARGILES